MQIVTPLIEVDPVAPGILELIVHEMLHALFEGLCCNGSCQRAWCRQQFIDQLGQDNHGASFRMLRDAVTDKFQFALVPNFVVP